MISYFTTRSVRVFGLLCVMLMLSIGSDANEPAGSTVVVIGSVNIERLNGALVGLQANDDIYLSERIKTGPDGLAKVLLRDDSMLKISPESDVTITDMIAGPGSDGESSVELLKGRLRSVIGNKISSGAQYTIKTPVAVAGVRGTDFEVVHMLVDGKWTSALRCFDGSVEFSSANKKVLILPNNYSLVQQGGEVSQPKTIAPNHSCPPR